LEREYDEEQYFIKSTNVEVYTMDDHWTYSKQFLKKGLTLMLV
jgi:hypothetical protein